MTNREKSIEWWNSLDFEVQVRLKNEHMGAWFPISWIGSFSIEIIYETLHAGN